MMTFISVDLPAPLRPISPTGLPGGIAAVARSRIVRPPRRTVIPAMVSMPGRLAANHGKDETGWGGGAQGGSPRRAFGARTHPKWQDNPRAIWSIFNFQHL